MSFSVGGSRSKYKGIFLNKATVKSVEDLSNTTLPGFTSLVDLAVKVTFTLEKFDKTITIFGNFKKDADGRSISIGSAFKVTRFFEELGIVGELTPANTIPSEWLKTVEGRECYTLDYLVGVRETDPSKGKYYSFDFIGNDPDMLANDFYKGVAKGFPKNFNPNALQGATTFGVAAGEIGDAYEGADPALAVAEMTF